MSWPVLNGHLAFQKYKSAAIMLFAEKPALWKGLVQCLWGRFLFWCFSLTPPWFYQGG